jgi:hypothetical protein
MKGGAYFKKLCEERYEVRPLVYIVKCLKTPVHLGRVLFEFRICVQRRRQACCAHNSKNTLRTQHNHNAPRSPARKLAMDPDVRAGNTLAVATSLFIPGALALASEGSMYDGQLARARAYTFRAPVTDICVRMQRVPGRFARRFVYISSMTMHQCHLFLFFMFASTLEFKHKC